MNRKQIENLYLVNGIDDFKLRSQEDLLKTHGIKVEQIRGYENLGDIHKKIFKGFILNFFNGCGMELRSTLEPVTVDYVRHTDYSFYDEEFGCRCSAGFKDEIIMADGTLVFDKKYTPEDAKGKKIKEDSTQDYLRFEYYEYGEKFKEEPRVSWLHVYSEESYG
nr:hypothetical protein [Clostridium chromiireducens]